MPDMTNPELLKTPLAKNGDKNTLPLTTGATTGLFSQDLGFQEINSTPLTAGGKAPDRKDMNAAFNLLGGVAFMAQKGWTFHYDASQDYYLGCVVIDPADGNRYECIADMAAGTVAPHEDTDGDYWRRFTLGDGEAVGVIKAFAGNGDLPSGYLLCDGSAVSRTMYPDLFATRYKFTWSEEIASLSDYDLFLYIGKKRGFLISGGEVDTERCANMLLDEFRAAKIGRITLDSIESEDTVC